MAKPYQRTLLVALLSLAPVFAGCDSAVDLSGVPEPAAAIPTVAFHPKEVTVVTRVFPGTTGVAISDYVTKGKSATLTIGKYQLVVPRGAVQKPTRFAMVVLENDMIGVKLYAFDKDWNEVRQFEKPVQLTLPYDEADETLLRDKHNKLFIANVVSENDATILEMVSARVDESTKTVTGDLYHFSVWSLAIQLSKEFSPGID